MKGNSGLTIAFFIMLGVLLAVPAYAQRGGGRSDSDALTGANPVAPYSTGVGQVMAPIIPSPLTTPEKKKQQAEGLVTPYPTAQPQPSPEKMGGKYYGEDVKQSGQYYSPDVKMNRREGAPPPAETTQQATPPSQ